jgi:hypothetical protein
MNRTCNSSSAPVPRRRRSPAIAAAALVAVALALALAPAALATGAQAKAGGSGWRISELPLPANAATKYGTIDAVSCRTAAQCVAVGAYQYPVDPSAGLIESWSGNSWSASQAPLAPGATATTRVALDAISCPARTTFCVAGGSGGVLGQSALLLTESGGTWTAAIAPVPGADPAATDSWIGGISCVSATWCMADGFASIGNRVPGLLLHLSGKRWTAMRAVPVPPGGGTTPSLGGVSCTSRHFCIAAGNYQKRPGEIVPMALTWNGRRWTARRLPLPRTATPLTTEISAVVCRSRKLCVAVGASTANAANVGQVGLIELWNGSKWTAPVAPLPKGQRSVETLLTGIACPTAKSCTAIGDYTNLTNVTTGFALTWSHGKWTATNAPAPNEFGLVSGQPTGISCPSATFCVAGDIITGGGPAVLTRR